MMQFGSKDRESEGKPEDGKNDSANQGEGTVVKADGERSADDSKDTGKTDNTSGATGTNREQEIKDAGVLNAEGMTRDMSAKEAGIDIESAQSDVDRVIAEDHLASRGIRSNPNVDEVIYSSHPIQNFAIGPYQFTDTLMRLKADAEPAFLKILDQLPPADRLAIKKIDLKAVDAIIDARESMGIQGVTDSSAGKAALEALKRENPTVGTRPLSQTGFVADGNNDGNDVKPATPAFDPEGKTGMDQGPHTADSAEKSE